MTRNSRKFGAEGADRIRWRRTLAEDAGRGTANSVRAPNDKLCADMLIGATGRAKGQALAGAAMIMAHSTKPTQTQTAGNLPRQSKAGELSDEARTLADVRVGERQVAANRAREVSAGGLLHAHGFRNIELCACRPQRRIASREIPTNGPDSVS